MSTPSPECVRTNEHLLDYAYGELAGAPLQELEAHLPGCPRCQGDLAALKSTRRVMSSLQPEAAPAAGLESLLSYAQNQAKRQAAPARPKWLGWLFAAVPVAAVVLITSTVLLRGGDRAVTGPSVDAREVSPEAVPAAPPPAQPEPKLAKADDGKPEEARPEPARQAASPGQAKGGESADAVALGHLQSGADKDQAKVAYRAPAHAQVTERKLEVPHKERARHAAEPQVATEVPAPEPQVATAAPVAPPPPGRTMGYESAPSREQAEAASAALDQVRAESGKKKAAGKNVALDEKRDALAKQEAGPAPAAQPMPSAAAPEMLGGAAAGHGDVAMAQDRAVAPLAQADALRRAGNHAAAAAAYRAYYQAHRHTARGAEALFSSALEAQAAGLLARAAGDFEQYAQEFPGSSRAPTALARAIEIRRSRDGEGAATTLEQDLLRRYPDSPEAQGLPARAETRRAAAKPSRMKAPTQLDDEEQAPAPAPATSQPAERR